MFVEENVKDKYNESIEQKGPYVRKYIPFGSVKNSINMFVNIRGFVDICSKSAESVQYTRFDCLQKFSKKIEDIGDFTILVLN